MTEAFPEGSERPVLVHVTTTDISLALLLGPQLQAFAAAGFEVIGASAPGPFVSDLQAAGIRHVPLVHATRTMSLRRDVLAALELYRLFRELRPQIVHTHNPKPGVYGRVSARAARVPVVVNTVHGLYATGEDSLRRRAAVYTLERMAAACSDAELVQNPEDVETLASLGIRRSKLHLLGNGVDLDRFHMTPELEVARRRLREEWGVGPDDIVVGAVGRLVWEKGYKDVFDAARRLTERVPHARFVIAGPDDPGKADAIGALDIEAASAAGVIFLGHRADVEHLYAAFDIYILASYREGFPRSAMEAASMGLPIVATDIRGCRQVVDDGITGVLVPPRRPDYLATAIERLASDPVLRSSMGGAAAAKARRDFDQQKVIALTLEIYEQLRSTRAAARRSLRR